MTTAVEHKCRRATLDFFHAFTMSRAPSGRGIVLASCIVGVVYVSC